MRRIAPETMDAVNELFESFNDLDAEGVHFTRDDLGNWFASAQVLGPNYTACVYFVLRDGEDSELQGMLEATVSTARGLDAGGDAS